MTLVIRGATLIDGTGAGAVADQAVVVEGKQIVWVGPSLKAEIGPDTKVIEAGGKTLMPGMIDCHAHMIAYEYNLEKRVTTPATLTVLRSINNLKITLEGGVTTVRDAGGCDLGFKIAVDQGLVVGPRLFVSVVPLTQTGGLFDLPLLSGAKVDLSGMTPSVRLFCGGVDNLRQITRRLLLEGADWIKISTTGSVYTFPGKMPAPQFTIDEISAVTYEAHAAGKKTMTHCEGGPGLKNAVLGGIDSIEHGFYLSDDDVRLMVDRDVYLIPTLACNYGILKVMKRDPKADIHEQSIRVAKDLIADHARSFARAAEAGVKIAMGSDSFGRDQGESLMELEHMVNAGLSPMNAIVAATSSAARLLGEEERLGTVTPGKFADLLLVDGNPLMDIRVLQDREKLKVIMKDGAIFKNSLN
jgi:imidazolonepropionase-like amidohydrolase